MIPVFDDAVVDSLSRTLADALVGSDITRMFNACDIIDSSGEQTKWKRLYYTFNELQRVDKCANRIGQFVQSALAPARWSAKKDQYDSVRHSANQTLLLVGLEVRADGKLHSVKTAATLDEATERANRLRAKLEQRSVHPEVLKFSRRLLIRDGNYFHAVFEATKSIMDRLRVMSTSSADGNVLIDETLERGQRPFPLVALNRYDTP